MEPRPGPHRHRASTNGSLFQENKPGTIHWRLVSIPSTEENTMFEHALLESARHIPGVRRTYSTAASLLLQAAALAMFVVVPILSTQIAPQLQLRQLIVVPQLTSPAPPVESSNAPAGTSPFSTTAPLRQPRTIPALDHSPR